MELFGKDELKSLTMASIVMGIIFSKGSPVSLLFFFSAAVVSLVPRILIAKWVAGKMNGKAVFKLNFGGSIAGLILSLFGIRLCPVGSVQAYGYKFGRWNRKFLWFTLEEKGIVAMSATVVTLAIASFFLLVGNTKVALMNAWFAFSTLIPFKGFDGENLVKFDFGVWIFFFILSFLMVIMWI